LPQTLKQVRRILRDRGFRRIDLAEEGDVPFLGTACREGRRYRIRVNLYGDVNVGKRIGRCNAERLGLDEIAARLRRDGYDRIEVFQDGPRRVRAIACRSGKQYRMVTSRRGDMLERSVIGRCPAPLSPRDIASFLETKGYDRVEVFDRSPPRYGAEACKGLDRVELSVGRFGRIRREIKVGSCPPPISAADLRRKMAQNGFTRVRVMPLDNGEFNMIACRGDKRMKLRFSRYGEALNRENIGGCRSPRIEELLSRLDQRGVEDMTIHIEGCRRGRKFRFTFDEFGERLGRERIGRC